MLLAAVALVGVALSAVGPLWAEEAERDREEELLRVGEAYARAIASYYHAVPDGEKRFPTQLGDLLQDKRLPGTRRHLRKLYADPLAPERAWGLMRAPDGGVAGVFSQDSRQPWRRGAVESDALALMPNPVRYSDWKFAPRLP